MKSARARRTVFRVLTPILAQLQRSEQRVSQLAIAILHEPYVSVTFLVVVYENSWGDQTSRHSIPRVFLRTRIASSPRTGGRWSSRAHRSDLVAQQH
jgi:hypothetical protein